MEQVGRYRVLGPLGRGAMGVVYLADDPLLNRKVAIKTVDLAVEEESDRQFLCERLLKDARAAAALAHPGIVGVFDVLQEGDMAYLVMEYIAGESLAAVLKKTPRPETAFTLRVLREMAAALDYTHARGIIHRDIKPANVMIDATGAAKIMDFGIARITDSRTSTPTGMVMGTIQYMAPEQVKGEALDGKADQFALAAVAYEMLTGSTLFGQHSLTTLAYKIVNEVPVPVRERNASVPPGVDAAMGRALSKSPQERFAGCGQFVAALERAFAGPPATDAAPTVTLATPPGSHRTSGRTAVVAGLLGAALAGGGLALWRPWAKPAPAAVVKPAIPSIAQAPMVSLPPPARKITPKKTAPAPASPPEASPASEAATDPQEAMPESGAPPSHPAVEAFEQARQLNESGDVEAALRAVDKAIVLNPKYGRAFFLRGQLRQKLKQWDAAAADFSEALRIVPRHAVSFLQRGVCYAELRQDEQALRDFDKAIEFRPDLFQAFNQRGMVFARRMDYPKAIADFSQAIRLAPNAPLAYKNRASARRASGDGAGANQDLRQWRQLK